MLERSAKMDYQIMPMGKIWENGMFSVPSLIAKEYIKLASEYQLKALLLILSNSGKADSRMIAKALGCTESDADDFLEFWVDEGVLICDNSPAPSEAPKKEEKSAEKEEKKTQKEESKALETLPCPSLTPADIVAALRESPDLAQMLQTAQEVKGKTLSSAEQGVLINMVQYYGLPCEIALTILQYYVGEKSKGKAIGTAYLGAMAKNWSEEGITSLDAAEEKLRELENSNRLWKEILAAASIAYRNPSLKQREMIKDWSNDFSMDMIFYACEIMRENAEKPNIKYVNGILQNWKKAGIKTIDEAKTADEKHQSGKEKTKKNKKNQYDIDSTYDIDDITKKAMFNEDYDF